MRTILLHTSLTPEELFTLKRLAEECRVREFAMRGSPNIQEFGECKGLIDKLLSQVNDHTE